MASTVWPLLACGSIPLSQCAEGCNTLLVKILEELLEMLFRLPRKLKLHGRNLVHEILHRGVDVSPAHLALPGALSDSFLRHFVEANNHPHHADGLAKRAHEVIISEAILLQEILSDDFRNLEGALLILGQGILANKLHNLLEVVLFLQDLLYFLLQHAILGIKPFEIRLKRSDILREGDVPIDRWEVLPLRQLLIET